MGFFSGLFQGAKNALGNLYHHGTRALGTSLYSGMSALAPYLFPTFYSPEAVNARNDVGKMISRGIGYAFTGH
jgi:hypothetical protein